MRLVRKLTVVAAVAAAALGLSACQELSTSNPALNRIVPPQELYVTTWDLLVETELEGVDAEEIFCGDSAALAGEEVPLNFLTCFVASGDDSVEELAVSLAEYSDVDGVTGQGVWCDPDNATVAVPLCYTYTTIDGFRDWFAIWVTYETDAGVATHLALIEEIPPSNFVRID